MSLASIFALAVGLAMDAMAVAAARGIATPRLLPRHVLLVALYFGGFQALMPLLGYYAGAQVGPWITAWDHWVAFVLLGAVGGKLLWEGLATSSGSPEVGEDRLFAPAAMLVLAVATSIDALAVGFTLPMLEAPLVTSVITIGLTTAALSGLGITIGRRLGPMLGKRLDVFGGLVLIGLGAKILFEHLATH